MSPTERTLAELRKRGYVAQVVERWVPQARRRVDLWGVIDVLAIREGEVLGVQATSRPHVAHRVAKIAEAEHIGAIREAGIRVAVWGWGKMASGRWELREVDCS